MAPTSQQRSWYVLEFHKTNSVVTLQRAFKPKFNVDPPTSKSILKWHRNFIERGYICDQRKGHSGRPSVSEQVFDHVRESSLHSPGKSTRRTSQQLKVPQIAVNKILRKRSRLYPYKLRFVQKLHPEDKKTRHAFCGNLRALIENDDELLTKIIFSDEATFHNTFTAVIDHSRFNNSCLKLPASTLVDLIFQSLSLRSFSLNQLRDL